MRIAVEGCGHGTLHSIYASVRKSCQIKQWEGVDLLIIGGDFQAVRNSYDLNSMSVPAKYREIADFHEYYSGKRTAPYLTLFIGGNHEASSHLQELYYGGWVAPNIYYLGAANVIRFGDLRIAGLTGIWKGYHYQKGHYERLPYTDDERKSVYHVREFDVRKLLLVRDQVDVGLSHDWPRSIEWEGDHKTLFKWKGHLEEDARIGKLGSPAAKYVMDRLRPPYWFAAHLHCKFAASVEYSTGKPAQVNGKTSNHNENEIDLDADIEESTRTPASQPEPPTKNADEIDLDLDDEDADTVAETKPEQQAPEPQIENQSTASFTEISEELRAQLPASFQRTSAPSSSRPHHRDPAPPPPENITNTRTSFLALDKCLPNRKFLQLLEIEPFHPSSPPSEPVLTYDPEWLSILRIFSDVDPRKQPPSNLGEAAYAPLIAESRAWVEDHVVKAGKLAVPLNFEITGPVYDGKDIRSVGKEQPQEYTSPQTQTFCEMLRMKNWFHESQEERERFRERKQAIVKNEEQSAFGGGGRGGHGRGGGRGRGRR